MINRKQSAIIRKDLKSVTSDKQQFSVLLIVPFTLTVVIPTLFILMGVFGMDNLSDIEHMLGLLGISSQNLSDPMVVTEAILNYVMPVFFMIIPVMAAMVMAASAFVGEKENRTLETLLYSPLTLSDIFQAKIFASFALSLFISFGSFLLMILVVETEVMLTVGRLYIPSINWVITLLLISPAVSLIAITLIVRSSAKAQTMQAAQQRAVYLVLPIVLLVVGQFTGLFLIGPLLLTALGVIFALIAFLLLRSCSGRFTYETLLK